jgi:hypothetical protein
VIGEKIANVKHFNSKKLNQESSSDEEAAKPRGTFTDARFGGQYDTEDGGESEEAESEQMNVKFNGSTD